MTLPASLSPDLTAERAMARYVAAQVVDTRVVQSDNRYLAFCDELNALEYLDILDLTRTGVLDANDAVLFAGNRLRFFVYAGDRTRALLWMHMQARLG